MKIGRSHLPWLVFVSFATLATALLYAANYFPQRLPIRFGLPAFFGETPPTRHTYGGTPLGLILGSLAFAIFLFASALGIRKKRKLWPLGNVQLWLKAHIWLSIFTLPLVLFHCGFRAGGPHTTWLLVLYFVVMVSGFFGLALQQFMPRLMKERLPREVVFEQIPRLRAQLHDDALKLRRNFQPLVVTSRGGAEAGDSSVGLLEQFLDDECLPYLAADRGDRLALGHDKTAFDRFRMLKLNLATEWQPVIETFERWCGERRLLDLQTRYQHWLHGWLVVHIPTSFALLIFTAWHAWVAVRFLVIS